MIEIKPNNLQSLLWTQGDFILIAPSATKTHQTVRKWLPSQRLPKFAGLLTPPIVFQFHSRRYLKRKIMKAQEGQTGWTQTNQIGDNSDGTNANSSHQSSGWDVAIELAGSGAKESMEINTKLLTYFVNAAETYFNRWPLIIILFSWSSFATSFGLPLDAFIHSTDTYAQLPSMKAT